MPATAPPLTDDLKYRSIAQSPGPLDTHRTPEAHSRVSDALQIRRRHPDQAELLEPLESELSAVRSSLTKRVEQAESKVKANRPTLDSLNSVALKLANDALDLERERQEAVEASGGPLSGEARAGFRRQRLRLLEKAREARDEALRTALDKLASATRPIPNPPEAKAASVSLALAKADDLDAQGLAQRALQAAADNDLTARALADGYLLKMERRLSEATERIEDPDLDLTERQEYHLRRDRDLLTLTVDLVRASQETEHTVASELAVQDLRRRTQALGQVMRSVAEDGSWFGSDRASLDAPAVNGHTVSEILGLPDLDDPWSPEPPADDSRIRQMAEDAERDRIRREREALARKLGTTPEAVNALLDKVEAEAA